MNRLGELLLAARELPREELPRFLGQLEEVRITALARLSAPAPAPAPADELLGIEEAARRLGVSRIYLYRHHGKLPFTRRMGKKLLFSSLGIDKHIRNKSCV